MIPRIKTYKVMVVETGETYYFDTISKKMAKLIMKLDYPKSWGKTLRISVYNNEALTE